MKNLSVDERVQGRVHMRTIQFMSIMIYHLKGCTLDVLPPPNLSTLICRPTLGILQIRKGTSCHRHLPETNLFRETGRNENIRAKNGAMTARPLPDLKNAQRRTTD